MSSKMEGAIIMIVLNLLAAVLAFFGGIILDNFYQFFRLGGYYEALPIAWQGTGTLMSMINLYYFACIVIAGVGWLIFALSIYKNEGIDTQRMYSY